MAHHGGSFLGQISQVTTNLYVSGVAPVQNADLLRQKRVSCVINVTAEDNTTIPPSIVRDLKDYIHIKVEDVATADLSAYFDYVADKIESIKKVGGKTLVHCGAGVSRSPTLVLAYLVKHEEMTLRAAFYHVIAIRPVVSPNIGFWKQLISYEKNLTNQTTVQLRPVEQRPHSAHGHDHHDYHSGGSSSSSSNSQPQSSSSALSSARGGSLKVDYVSLVNDPTLRPECFQPDVYREKSKCRRDIRPWVSRTPPLRTKHHGSGGQSKYGAGGQPQQPTSARSSPRWPVKRFSGQFSEDWNGRVTANDGHGSLSSGPGYYKRYSTSMVKRNQGSVFESLTSMCDSFLPGL